jgi:hypothetical protein
MKPRTQGTSCFHDKRHRCGGKGCLEAGSGCLTLIRDVNQKFGLTFGHSNTKDSEPYRFAVRKRDFGEARPISRTSRGCVNSKAFLFELDEWTVED